jgi:hypothetical protein
MEATLGISLYSYPSLKLAKTLCLSYYLLCFLFNKVGDQEDGTVSAWKVGGAREETVAQIMCTHVNKCKSDQIKF